MKYVKTLLGIFLFFLIFALTYIGYIKFFRVDVVFYSSLIAALVAVLLFAVCLFRLAFFTQFSAFEKTQLLIICGLLGYVGAISVPTVIDRSLSFYILEKLQQRGGGIQLSKFNYIFTTEYMKEHRLVDIRITEQVASGTIVVDDNGCVKLTPRGDFLASLGQYFRKNLLPKQRLVLGTYTADLTDPFTRSDAAPDYLCE